MSNQTKQAQNRRARYDYKIGETLTCGIMLQGWEVKAFRAGRAQITGSYVAALADGLYLVGAHITPLITAPMDCDPTRSRKLLVTKHELDNLREAVAIKGITIVPTSMKMEGGLIKVVVGLASGKKQHDKREAIKDREWQRNKARANKHD